jgi:hypothetical protein
MRIKEIVIHVASLGLAAVAYGLSKWALDHGASETAGMLGSFFISVTIFVAVQRIAEYTRLAGFEERFAGILESKLPGVKVVHFSTSDEAMEYLTRRITSAKTCLNTRISRHAVPPKAKVGDPYQKAVRKAISGGTTYREVISTGFKDRADELASYAIEKPGSYNFHITPAETSSFANFTVLDYGNGESKEVVLGWTTSKVAGTEQPALLISDTKVADFFSQYFQLLCAS